MTLLSSWLVRVWAVALTVIVAGLAIVVLLRAPGVECRPPAQSMKRLELVFGMSRPGAPEIGVEAWNAFVDREVTPRFADGLTTLEGRGQWRNRAGDLIKEPSRILLIWLHAAPAEEAKIEDIRRAWMVQQQQDSVLRADEVSCVRF